MVGLLSDNLIIAKILGAAMVTPFFVTQRLITIAVAQVRGISNASWAALTELHVTGEREVFTARVLELTSLVVVLGLATLVPIAAFNHAFIRLWVGEQTYAGQAVTILAAVNGLVASVLSVWIWLFDGTGQAARLVPMALIGAALNVAASIVCTKLFQLPGPLIGTTLAYAGVQMIWLPLLVRATFGIPITRLLTSITAPLAIAIPVAALCAWISIQFPPRTWLTLALAMATAALAYLALAWITLLSERQKSLWINRVRLALPR
jgi:O-antigen/teichoic acid export membrane protein